MHWQWRRGKNLTNPVWIRKSAAGLDILVDDVVIIMLHAILTVVLHHSVCVWESEQGFSAGNHQYFHCSTICHCKQSQGPCLLEQWCPLSVFVVKQLYYFGAMKQPNMFHDCSSSKMIKIIDAHKAGSVEETLLQIHTNPSTLSCICTRIPAQRALLLKPKGKKRLLSLSPSSSSGVHWLSLSSFHLSCPLLLPLSAIGNIVIIKAKEYLWVSTPSISLCPLWPAIISHTHPHTHPHTLTHTLIRTVYTQTNTHTSISSCDWITFWLIVLLRAKQW